MQETEARISRGLIQILKKSLIANTYNHMYKYSCCTIGMQEISLEKNKKFDVEDA